MYSTFRHENEECLYPLSNQNIDIKVDVAFYMMTTCNKTINCYELQQNPWGPLLPVFSPSRQKIYINKNCAACNGVQDGKEWGSYIVLQNSNASDIDTILSALRFRTFAANCHAFFTYPYDDVYMLRKLQCYKKALVDSCPKKPALGINSLQYLRQFNIDQNSIAELCSSSFQSVYVHTWRINYYFKNVFCFICNHDKLPNKKCPLDSKYPAKGHSNQKFITFMKWMDTVSDVDALPFSANEEKVFHEKLYILKN